MISVGKAENQIRKVDVPQIDVLNVEHPVRAGKKRRSKQLSVRNIQIAATVEVW